MKLIRKDGIRDGQIFNRVNSYRRSTFCSSLSEQQRAGTLTCRAKRRAGGCGDSAGYSDNREDYSERGRCGTDAYCFTADRNAAHKLYADG